MNKKEFGLKMMDRRFENVCSMAKACIEVGKTNDKKSLLWQIDEFIQCCHLFKESLQDAYDVDYDQFYEEMYCDFDDDYQA